MKGGLESVPKFTPSEAEFADPFKYFAKLRDAGRTYGILRIVTPETWRPKEEPQTHPTFDSYRQAIHTLRTGRSFDTVANRDASGDDYTVESYREYADGLTENWIQQHPELNLDLSAYVMQDADMKAHFSAKVEQSYWDMVEGRSKDKMEVDYASNHPVVKYYPVVSDRSAALLCRSFPGGRWDLSSLFHEDENLLKRATTEVPGVTHPWIYHGCLFSTFCWHVEDHFMYSVNYLHAGAPKIWYGIPASGAADFENHITASYCTRSMKSDVLNRLTLMLSPYAFPKGLPVFKAVQKPGDMILTFPRAFHGGYNEGWNCAEAVNFAMTDWVMFGQLAIRRYNIYSNKKALFSHSKLLWRLMLETKQEKETSTELRKAVLDACRSELDRRTAVRSRVYNIGEAVPRKGWDMGWKDWACSECKAPLFFSYVSCRCRVDDVAVLCLHHALDAEAFSCGCKPFLCLEKTDDELNAMMRRVKYETDTDG